MPEFTFNHFTALPLTLLIFLPTPHALSFLFQNFTTITSNLSLLGDARVINTDSSVGFTSGGVIFNNPTGLVQGNPKRKVSFSTSFRFSTGGLAFLLIPTDLLSHVLDYKSLNIFSVEFGGNFTHLDADNLISVSVENVSSAHYKSWIDYQAGSNRLEIRLNRSGDSRPRKPLGSYEVDLSDLFKEEVFVGFSSLGREGAEMCRIYSWGFQQRIAPTWLHSRPLDPAGGSDERKRRGRRSCVLRVVAALFAGAGFGASVSVVVLFLWTVVHGESRLVVPERAIEVVGKGSMNGIK